MGPSAGRRLSTRHALHVFHWRGSFVPEGNAAADISAGGSGELGAVGKLELLLSAATRS